MRLKIFFFACLAFGLAACGQSETSKVSPLTNQIFLGSGASLYIKAFLPDPVSLDRVPNTDQITNVPPRQLILQQYEAAVEADLNRERTEALSMITGVGLEAQDTTAAHAAVPLKLGIIAREFDFDSGNFRPGTRVFAAPAEDLTGAQTFGITNTDSGNFVLTGLALRAEDATITKLLLQRKTLSKLKESADDLEATKKVILPPGWAAVGIMVKFSRVGTRTPFLGDLLIFKGAITSDSPQ